MSVTSVLLPEPDAPVTATICPSGIVTVSDLRLFSRAPRMTSDLPLPCPALRRHRDRARAREVLTRRRRLALEHVGDRPLRHDASAVHARARPHLDDVIGGANRVLVVLDDDHGVADVAKPLDRRDHLDVVFRMQPDARLVEHVEHAHQARADLRRQPDALRLAARQRARSPVEAEIVQADAEQQIQPAANVIQHLSSGVGAAAGRLHRGKKALQLVEVQLAQLVEVAAVDPEEQPRRAHARALALRARALDHHLVEPLLHARVRFAALAVPPVVPLDPARDPVKADLAPVRTAAKHLRIRRRHHLDLRGADAVEDGVANRFGQQLPRRVEREVQQLRQAEHQPAVPCVRVVLERLAHEAAAENAAVGIRARAGPDA